MSLTSFLGPRFFGTFDGGTTGSVAMEVFFVVTELVAPWFVRFEMGDIVAALSGLIHIRDKSS
jgi:hypothetical protein